MTDGRRRTVLFLCTGNSARSQMAEALLRQCAGGRYDVLSAGTDPQGIHPMTRVVLGEIGIDIGGQRSKSLTEYLGRAAVHTVITVCDRADKACPAVWPGVVKRLAWHFEDPAACGGTDDEKRAKFRAVRDQIHVRIQEWLRDETAG